MTDETDATVLANTKIGTQLAQQCQCKVLSMPMSCMLPYCPATLLIPTSPNTDTAQ